MNSNTKVDNDKPFAALARVSGGWFWAVWLCRSDFFEKMRSRQLPKHFGVARSKQDAKTSAASIASDVTFSTSGWMGLDAYALVISTGWLCNGEHPDHPETRRKQVAVAKDYSAHEIFEEVDRIRDELIAQLKERRQMGFEATQALKRRLAAPPLPSDLSEIRKLLNETEKTMRRIDAQLNHLITGSAQVTRKLFLQAEANLLLKTNPALRMAAIQATISRSIPEENDH